MHIYLLLLDRSAAHTPEPPPAAFQSYGTSRGKYHMLSAFVVESTFKIKLPRGIMDA